jgi:hypothetical protein
MPHRACLAVVLAVAVVQILWVRQLVMVEMESQAVVVVASAQQLELPLVAMVAQV